jgi:hypothetical protein
MRTLLSFLVCLIAFASVTAAKSDIKLEIGAELPRKYASKAKGQIATHPSQSRPYIEQTIDGVDYIIGLTQARVR